MEPASKKFKAEISKDTNSKPSDGNMDPFDVDKKLFDVVDLILQHLSGTDLLEATEVSPDWCNMIENTKRFIDKVKLIVDESFEDESQRKYVSMEIRFRQCWISAGGSVQRMLEKLAGTLVTLKFDRIYILEDLPAIQFSKLKSLAIGNNQYNPRKQLATRAARRFPPSIPFLPPLPQEIIEFLQRVPNLESLTIYKYVDSGLDSVMIDREIFDKITSVSKKLKHLRCPRTSVTERYALSKGVNLEFDHSQVDVSGDTNDSDESDGSNDSDESDDGGNDIDESNDSSDSNDNDE